MNDRIVGVRKGDIPSDRGATYSVAVNSFIAAGGDNFTVLLQGTNQVGGPGDLDALVDYIENLPQPFTAVIEGRITWLNEMSCVQLAFLLLDPISTPEYAAGA